MWHEIWMGLVELWREFYAAWLGTRSDMILVLGCIFFGCILSWVGWKALKLVEIYGSPKLWRWANKYLIELTLPLGVIIMIFVFVGQFQAALVFWGAVLGAPFEALLDTLVPMKFRDE